jgi:hypothetical protein
MTYSQSFSLIISKPLLLLAYHDPTAALARNSYFCILLYAMSRKLILKDFPVFIPTVLRIFGIGEQITKVDDFAIQLFRQLRLGQAGLHLKIELQEFST